MKLLVSGGRNLYIKGIGIEYLDNLHEFYYFTELVNGMATGIDLCVRTWARANFIPIKEFPANWSLGKKAGPIRNEEMAKYCGQDGICVLFPGGKGTQNMCENAVKYKMRIINLMDKMEFVYEN